MSGGTAFGGVGRAFFRLFGSNWGRPAPVGRRPLRAGIRLFVRGRSAWPGNLPQRIALPGGAVAAVLEHAGKAAFETDDGNDALGEACHQVAGETSAADARVVFVAGDDRMR